MASNDTDANKVIKEENLKLYLRLMLLFFKSR